MHTGDIEREMLTRHPTLDITNSIWYQVRAKVEQVISQFIQSARENIAEHDDLHRLKSEAECLDFIDSRLADDKYCLPVAERAEGGVHSPDPTQRESKAATEWRQST